MKTKVPSWLPEKKLLEFKEQMDKEAKAVLPAKDKTLEQLMEERTAEYWAPRLHVAFGGTHETIHEAIVAFGRELIAARNHLQGHGEQWRRLFATHKNPVEHPVEFSEDTAERFMAIAENAVLSAPANFRKLPTAWTTLFELTKVSPTLLEQAVYDGRVHADMKGIEVKTLVKELKGRKQTTYTTTVAMVPTTVPTGVPKSVKTVEWDWGKKWEREIFKSFRSVSLNDKQKIIRKLEAWTIRMQEELIAERDRERHEYESRNRA